MIGYEWNKSCKIKKDEREYIDPWESSAEIAPELNGEPGGLKLESNYLISSVGEHEKQQLSTFVYRHHSVEGE